MSEPCPNCSSTKHRACCCRCGALIRGRRVHVDNNFCTDRCAIAQIREDRISRDLEHDNPTKES